MVQRSRRGHEQRVAVIPGTLRRSGRRVRFVLTKAAEPQVEAAMRVSATNQVLRARAIAGTYVVILAWDIDPNLTAELLGFAIHRTEYDPQGKPVESYWLRSIKRFKNKDKGFPPGTPVSTADHPIQSFQWGDYTARAGVRYEYRIVPTYGTPKLLELEEASAVTLDVTTEPELGDLAAEASAGSARHDIFFNRGVIGSQAYAREPFGNVKPDPDEPASAPMVWLSRGLFEALLRMIACAKDESFALRAAFYEFHYQPIANAFAKAVEAGVDVKIVFDAASSYEAENLATISRAGLDATNSVIARTVSEGIRHNKFVVLLKEGVPIGVWTGSTNISAGGIFGHSNVGHMVWDADVAGKFFEYWKRLAGNLTATKIRPLNRAATPTPNGKPPQNSVIALFSARDDKDSNATLQWYADRMADARKIVCITVAFNLDEVFQEVISRDNDVIRYIVKDDDLGDGENVGHDRDVIFAAGGYLGEGALANFLRERDNPLNRNDYIHTKFMLVDPLGKDPLVVTGSANFSRPSQRINDENMLVIRGDQRVADIYFGEYMRIFEHHYARYIVRKLTNVGTHDPDAGYLKTDTKDWVPAHFNEKSYKFKRRRYYLDED
jgi:phosphatidylserine/phosphatidylglycerophosphate/cardiolipin synthase-like enzyme